MQICDAAELMDYYADYPPTHISMRPVDKPRRGSQSFNSEEAIAQLGEVGQMLGGGAPSPMPQHLIELANWAEDLTKKT